MYYSIMEGTDNLWWTGMTLFLALERRSYFSENKPDKFWEVWSILD